MKVVCLEEHGATEHIFAAWQRLDPHLNDPVTRWTITGDVAPRLLELGNPRLDDIDVADIDVAVLSLTTPELQSLDSDETVALQRPTNDIIAAATRANPDRLEASRRLRRKRRRVRPVDSSAA